MTKSNSHKLNMSLLPVVLLVLLILGAGYFLMSGEFKLSKLFNREPKVRRLSGFPTVLVTDTIMEKQREVIKSQEDLSKFLNTIDKSGFLTFNEKIDFDREYLIGVATSTMSEQGTTMKVKKVYQDKENKSLVISVEQNTPDDDCVSEKQSNVAVDLVAISKTDWDIKFELVKKYIQCKENTTTGSATETE